MRRKAQRHKGIRHKVKRLYREWCGCLRVPNNSFRRQPSILCASVPLYLLFITFCTPLLALDTLVRENYDKTGRSFVKVDSVFGTGMRSGYLPFRVTIRNNTKKDRIWTVRFSESQSYRGLNYTSTFYFEVEDGSEITSEVMVPIPPSFVSGSTYRGVQVIITSPGLKIIQRANSEDSETGTWPSIGLSSKLALRSLSKLGDAMGKRGTRTSSSREIFGYEYAIPTLPSDWRGYTCLDVLMIDEAGWRNLNTSQRQAIIEWIRLGGRCDIYTSNKALSLGGLGLDQLRFTYPEGRSVDVSLGKLTIQTWDGKELDTNLISRYRAVSSRNRQIESDYGGGWQLLRDFGSKSFNPALVFILLIIFAIIVAPVNLFYFAKEGKRHKLFVTTPIISIAACLIIIAVIFLKDGLGGGGRRVGLADLQFHPDEMQLYLSQEQISRTGVMVSTGFSQKENITITPVNLPDSSWNPLSRSNASLGMLHFSGPNFSGDFFRSRTEQGYAINRVQSTRARIEMRSPPTKTAPPKLFSSLGFSVKDFLYYDRNGQLWRSPEGTRIDPGNPIPLKIANNTETTAWIKAKSKPFSSAQNSRIRKLTRRGRFFAIAEEPEKLLADTSTAIEWKNDFVMVTGIIALPESNPAEKPKPTTGE